jgi:hypothetical protein
MLVQEETEYMGILGAGQRAGNIEMEFVAIHEQDANHISL